MRDMRDAEWKIAKAGKPFLGYEDHGILTVSVPLNYGGSGQSLGLYSFSARKYENHENFDKTCYSPGGIEWIARLMNAFGVREFSKIEGRTVYALSDYGKVYGIRPLPTEDGEEFMFDEVSLWPNLVKGE